jgi:hypothetical protein
MTNLYNRVNYSYPALDITHASRSILWLKPDFVVIHDHAQSKTDDRFKRFNLSLVTDPQVNGHVAVETLTSGQQLFVQSLSPANAQLTSLPIEQMSPSAIGEPTRYRLVVEDPSNPKEIRFLHVLQGADASQPMDTAAYFASDDNLFDGARFGSVAVLFPVTFGNTTTSLHYQVPEEIDTHVVTGLLPDTDYDLTTQPVSGGTAVTVALGGSYHSDAAGVLAVNLGVHIGALTPTNATFEGNGGNGSVAVSVIGQTAWNATKSAPWITLTGNADGNGNGSVTYQVAANPLASSRTGSITIGGHVHTITQKGVDCTPTLNLSSASLDATASIGSVNVKIPSICAWNATSSADWLTITTIDNGTVSYRVEANPDSTPRTGVLTIAGRNFSVIQAGTGGGSGTNCSYSLSLARK